MIATISIHAKKFAMIAITLVILVDLATDHAADKIARTRYAMRKRVLIYNIVNIADAHNSNIYIYFKISLSFAMPSQQDMLHT